MKLLSLKRVRQPKGSDMQPRSDVVRLGLCLFLALPLGACETLSYYSQAIGGQLHILGQRQAIDDLLAAPDTDPVLKARLQEISAIRTFAAEQLQLPVGSQYSTYVDLQRSFVVWNVFATPEFSLVPLSWCYPIAGCASYRGYFSEDAAQEFAVGLQQQGLDIHVGGVAAYSTLGWFSDPVLNTIVNREPHQLASLLFHELAHQLVYVAGDTEFNESFATAVAEEGLQRWLRRSGTTALARETRPEAVRQEQLRQEQFVGLVQDAAGDLETLYASATPANEMRQAKAQRITQLRTSYTALKQEWNGYDGYDGWFSGDLNNARLATVGTYNALVPGFNALLTASGGDLAVFYSQVRSIARLDPQARRQRLTQAAQGMH